MNDHTPADGRHRMLAEGQALLMARREELRLVRERSGEAPSFCDPVDGNQLPVASKQFPVSSNQSSGHCSLNTDQLAEMVARLPNHLGWGSTAQTAILRAAAKRRSEPSREDGEHLSTEKLWPVEIAGTDTNQEGKPAAPDSVFLAPSLGLAILRHKLAAPARLWLLLRAVDIHGRGMISLETARNIFTDQASPLRFCGQRQLRNLLSAGSGTFWQTDEEHIWLRSPVRVAEALHIPYFRGKDVALPTAALSGGIAAVRANLYAAFHSGRGPKPISRQSLATKSGLAPRTQRHYDHISGVKKQANYARGAKVGSVAGEDQAWQQGPASFTWRESRKGVPARNGRILAWQLPNSYHGPHAQLGRGRQKRQNKALADLLNKGTAGNGQSLIDDLRPRYFADARAASRAFGRGESALYWPDIKPGLWHCLWPQPPCKQINHAQEHA